MRWWGPWNSSNKLAELGLWRQCENLLWCAKSFVYYIAQLIFFDFSNRNVQCLNPLSWLLNVFFFFFFSLISFNSLNLSFKSSLYMQDHNSRLWSVNNQCITNPVSWLCRLRGLKKIGVQNWFCSGIICICIFFLWKGIICIDYQTFLGNRR